MRNMTRENKSEASPKDVFNMVAFKYSLQYGEEGSNIVRMVGQYIQEGWMDFEQGTFMLRAVFERTPDDEQGNRLGQDDY